MPGDPIEYWEVESLPFGEVVNAYDQDDPLLRYPGQWKLWEDTGSLTNLFQNGYRWYNPGWGRYTQSDPLGFGGGGINLYSYALGNPLLHTDPLGRDVITVGCGNNEARVQAAAAAADAAARTCLPCEDRERFKETIRGDLVVECFPLDIDRICAATLQGGSIGIFPRGFSNQGEDRCGCLKSQILHEVLHIIGYGEFEAYDRTRRCFTCARRLGRDPFVPLF